MKVELNKDFFAIINVESESKNRNNPLEVKNGRIIDSALVTEYKSTYFLQYIETRDGILVIHAKHLPEFIELLNCFVANQLNINKSYRIKYTGGGGFLANITQKDGEKFLAFNIENNMIYLDKYSCRVLSSKLSKMMAKCEYEFHSMDY